MPTQRRVYASEASLSSLSPEEEHYVRHVLRLGDGEEIVALNGHGAQAPARLRIPKKGPIELTHVGPWRTAASLQHGVCVTLLSALPKGERADWLVEKATELGVERVQWILWERAVVELRGENKRQRLRRVAQSAARQAGHGRVPALLAPVPPKDALEALRTSAAARWVAHPKQHPTPLWPLAAAHHGPAHIAIGPEGGLTEAELQLLTMHGYTAVSLGPHVLRVETAAIAALAGLAMAASMRN